MDGQLWHELLQDHIALPGSQVGRLPRLSSERRCHVLTVLFPP
jgi:hypothetical protein